MRDLLSALPADVQAAAHRIANCEGMSAGDFCNVLYAQIQNDERETALASLNKMRVKLSQPTGVVVAFKRP